MRVRDFKNWLESAGRCPAEMSLKTRLRELSKSSQLSKCDDQAALKAQGLAWSFA
jgi:hypothetical protein